MNNLDNKIKELTISYLSIPENFNSRIDRILTELPRYNKRKNTTIKKVLIKIISFIIASISITAFATYINNHYTGNGKNILKITKEIDNSVYYSLDMIPYENIEGLSYIIIDNTKEFTLAKSVYDDLPNVDLEKEFLMILDFNNGQFDGLEMLEINANADTLNLILGNNELSDDSGKTLCFAISNQFYRDKIMIELLPGSSSIIKYGFTPMKDLNNDYINEKALQENCLILDGYNNVIYNTENDFINFIDNCKNNIDGAYRIIKEINSPELINEYAFEIQDIIYENNKFYRFLALYKKDDTDKKYSFETYQNDGVEIFINSNDNFNINQYCLRKVDGSFYRLVTFWH